MGLAGRLFPASIPMTGKAQVEALLALINNAAYQAVSEYDKTGTDVPILGSVDPHPLDGSIDTSALKKAIRVLEAACEQLCVTLAPPDHTIINRTQNCDWAGILVVLETRVADALAGHPGGLHVDDLSKVLRVEPGKLARILRLLATRHCFTEVGANVFANNRLSMMLHSSNPIRDLAYTHLTLNPLAISVLCENLTKEPYAQSYELKNAPIMHAMPPDEVKTDFYDWLKSHPEKRETFQRAMIGMGRVMGSPAILYNYNWDDCKTLCDLGCGVGNFSMPFARLYPNVRISMVDLPAAISQAKASWTKDYPVAIEENRVEFIEGDFFKPIPVKDQDIYYIGNCVHNWPDDLALKILQNIREAMGNHSRVLIHDYVMRHLNRVPSNSSEGSLQLDMAPEPLLPNFGMGSVRAHYQDFTMLLTYNAKERTLDEVSSLAEKAELILDGVFDIGETCVLQFRAAP
ncbi:S-adenosyl-L-methionine-dependent methyltransferase [Mycena crocata]|nr:S-adenosyl-L-methionine-dependent methyltransferase [Mycena crocata]